MSLAGCGSQETPASAETTGTVQASSEQPQATTEAAETTTDEDMTLDELIAAAQAEASAPDAGTFMVYAPTSRIEKALNAFAEEYGIQGEYYNESGQDLYTKLTTELEAGVKDTADVALLQDSYLFQTQLQNTWKDTAGMIFALFGTSMPNFWLGLMLIIIFALHLRLFPTGGNFGWKSLVLPAVTVGFGLAALITRITRSSMLDVMRQDYMTTARAKGCSEHRVIYKHGLKNALIPIITAIGLQMSLVITGSVLAETVFSWPGIGRLVYESITRRDIPMVTGSIILCSILMCLINLVVDLVYAFFDPRIKAQYSKKG